MDLDDRKGILFRLLPLLAFLLMKIDQLGIANVTPVVIGMSPVSTMGTFDLLHDAKVGTECVLTAKNPESTAGGPGPQLIGQDE